MNADIHSAFIYNKPKIGNYSHFHIFLSNKDNSEAKIKNKLIQAISSLSLPLNTTSMLSLQAIKLIYQQSITGSLGLGYGRVGLLGGTAWRCFHNNV